MTELTRTLRTFRKWRLVAIWALSLIAFATLLFAWNSAVSGPGQAAGPGPGMSLGAPGIVFVDEPFTLTISTDPAPDEEIAGFGSEVLFPDGLKWLPRASCLDEVQVGRADGGAIALCNSFSPILTGGTAHAVLTQFSSPAAALDIAPGSTTLLLELDFVCNTPGTYKLTLTATPDSPDGALYGSPFGEVILVKTVSQDYDGDTIANQVADTITINCASGPVTPTATPTPCPLAGCPTPVPPQPCPLLPTPRGSPLPGMSLGGPGIVALGVQFAICVNADPAPDVEIAAFGSEVLFPDGLKWQPRATCADEVVPRPPSGSLGLCQSGLSTLLGGARHAVISEIAAPPLAAFDIAPGSTALLLELDFVCNTPGTYKLTLTAYPESPDGALYADVSAVEIRVKTVEQDYDGDTVPNQVADTITINCVSGTVPPPTPTGPAVSVGSLSLDVGNQGKVELEALNMSDPGLGSWTIDVVYDPTVVSVLSCIANPLPGAFNDCNESFNTVTIRNVGFTGGGFVGDITLATITFLCATEGVSPLEIDATTLVLKDGTAGDPGQIAASVSDGSITCGPTPTATATPPETPAGGTPTVVLPTPTATPPATPDLSPELGWMSSGGSIFEGGRVTHGFTLQCDVTELPNSLQINWLGNSFHLENLLAATCSDDPAIGPNPPSADFDTYAGAGTGRYNGVSGATAEWTFTDAGEPGNNDFAGIVIRDASGNVVLSASGSLNSGDHQAHGRAALVLAMDSDRDGCTNGAEMSTDEKLGGRRNPHNFWDFFDTPDAAGVRDNAIALGDVLRVVARLGTSGDPNIDPRSSPGQSGYHPAYDRTSGGPNIWNAGPADGAISLQDIVIIVAQFGHSCA